jgi:predicted dehydrogenase
MGAGLHVLVVGFGSAGRRHAQNLSKRGATISVVDSRSDRLAPPSGLTFGASFNTIEQALSAGSFDAAVIATPTSFHVEQTEKLLAAGCHILLEKPVSLDSASAEKLRQAEAKYGRPILLGYTWRWWNALQELRKRVRDGAIGRPLRADLIMASHLEDWHPGEPLSEFFMSNAALGGGALLDESHWVDQMLWLFGPPDEIAADVERISGLPIDADDHVELNAFYGHGLRVRIHLDLYTRPTERSIAIFGDRGALRWSFDQNNIEECHGAAAVWDVTKFGGERNDMFDAVAAEFCEVCAGRAVPSCSLADGLVVMRIIDAARESHMQKGAKVRLKT